MCDLDGQKTIFPVVECEINCASDGLVETTKTSFPGSPAVVQSVGFPAPIPLRILLSRIPCKLISAKFARTDNNLACWIINLFVCILTRPTGEMNVLAEILALTETFEQKDRIWP